jgi:hypothetical protein
MAENGPVEKGDAMPMKIRSSRLTTCRVATDGTNVELEFIDRAGAPVTLELPFDQAEAVVMTLPSLLTRALRHHIGNDDARYVFGLREWSLESTRDQTCLIATLKTPDGFEVSFGIPLEACRSLGWGLQNGAEQAVAASKAREETLAPGDIKLN